MKHLFLIVVLNCASLSLLLGQNYKELLIEYQKGDFEYVIRAGVPLCKQNNKDLDLRLLVGRAYADNLQFSEALPYLRYVDQNAKNKCWQRGWCEIYLGVCNFGLNEYEWARTYMNRAASTGDTDNIRNYANEQLKLLGFSKVFDKFRLKLTDDIAFHFHPDVASNINWVEESLKQNQIIYSKAKAFFNCKAPKKIDLFIWPTPELLNDELSVNNGVVVKPELCLVHTTSSRTSCEDVALIISHYVSNIEKKSAIINYGTAAYIANSDKELLGMAKLKVKESGVSMVSVADIWAVNRYDSPLYNAVSAAFVEYLIEKEGKDKFLSLFKNQSYYIAKKVYGDKIDVLIKDFEKQLM